MDFTRSKRVNVRPAAFGGTGGTVALGTNITAGGLTLNSGYTIGPSGGITIKAILILELSGTVYPCL